ncbi:ABC transporter ATP-binding protein [Enterovirga rhinocerotis]|uniref:Iron complex transport system ATP-binding protein n=1 Tax=Enterovirga rhinocerotis TaxID=1339210 RepID=A0A4R7C8M6_9HYPH|nr:ABC transporter ATP-binding protein [Enterovirga rhinocerotis]TDR93206.1 iron complex transport system ATP-binding protein [Enterovirga rhinocerotis]
MILEGRGLAIGYPGRRVGEGLDMALAAGRATALLGPNGGGKTTLLKTLLGLIPPLAGEVRLDGVPLAAIPIRERARRIAYVPQSQGAGFGFTVFETVLMGRTAFASPFARPSTSDEEAARTAIARLGIVRLAERPITEISGGERQLTLIARALAAEPAVVLLDEPTASLDFGNQGRVLREIGALREAGLAVLFTTHDPNQALRHADAVAAIRDGRMIESGPARDILLRERLERLYGTPVEEVREGERRAFLPG